MKLITAIATAAAAMFFAGNALATEMPALAKELNCTTCHAIDKKVVGPAWAEVSKKYAGQKTYKYSASGSNAADAKEMALAEGLAMKVSKGGSGNWGSMPMPANDPTGAKKEKVEELVRFVLGLAK